MESPKLQQKPKEVTYFKLNNELNRPLNGKIQLAKDAEAAQAFFLEHVNPNTVFFHTLEEKLDYLLKEEYIEEEFLGMYKRPFVKRLFKKVYGKKHRFRSFMGAYKFYKQYALTTFDGKRYLERYEDRVAFNALYLAKGNETLALDIAEEMVSQRYQPATPTYLNAGKKQRGEMVSCFLLSVGDSMNDIGRVINSALQLSRIGGGVGISLSNLRAAGDPIKHIEGAASGVIPVMKLLEDAFTYSNQLGQRQGSGVVYLNVFHPDIVDFLSTRKENADEKIRIKTLSLGVVIPDIFYQLAINNETMYLFSPYDVERVYGEPFGHVDISKHYYDMVDNPEIRKSKISARELETEISKLQQESGYPYVLNIDTANRSNPINGRIIMSNLCSEILQTTSESSLFDDQSYDILGADISCNLGSTNISNLMKSPDVGKSLRIMARALTQVSDYSEINSVPSVKRGNDLSHSFGLGAMDMHGFLASNKIHYGSPESLEFTSVYFLLLNYWTLFESNQIAKERGESFHEFEKSTYATGEYFDKYLDFDWSPQLDRVKELFEGIFIPSREDWVALKESVQVYGVYSAYRLAVAPTGSISYVNEATSSIHPVIQRIEERQEKKTGNTYYPAPYLSDETIPYYTSAYDIDMRSVIDLYSAAQEHIDQGMSLTLYLRSTIPTGLYEWKTETEKQTTRDLTMIRHYAHQKGIKTLYYVRTFTDDEEEVGANMCENCSI